VNAVARAPGFLLGLRSRAERIGSASTGKDVLELWHSTYQAVRERIEKSGNVRWNFSRKELFEQTQYMVRNPLSPSGGARTTDLLDVRQARIADDLFDVAQTLEQFYQFLGNKLKSVTGDIKGIDEVLKSVQELVRPLEDLPFDPFDRKKTTSWDQVDCRAGSSRRRVR
jgi:dynein heavy chain